MNTPEPTCIIVLSALESSPTTNIWKVLLAVESPSVTFTVNE